MIKHFSTLCLVGLLCLLALGCNRPDTLFREIPAEESGIHFNNTLPDDELLNVLHYEYVYNGGGVGVGDFNNDGLQDLYFTGNRVANRLYQNLGNLKFKDITKEAGVFGNDKWCKGVSVVDINNDGWQDIYVSAAVLLPIEDRKNLLYVNQGVNASTGFPSFKEMAEEYGLADNSSTHMSAFFDFDNDGDLDVYLLVNELDGTYPNDFRPIYKDGSWPNTDRLLRNDWDASLRHGVFTDVSRQAGILIEGYGLGVNIVDMNQDGWKDIYVSNDYISNNHLYINNQNGTFSDLSSKYFKHSSKNAMGNDVADINNDGLLDVIEVDMAPRSNYRQKLMLNDAKYQTFQNYSQFGYMTQYSRNTLQLNVGPRVEEGDSIGLPVFADVAFYAGVAHTDWSWGPLFADLDNDGFKDLIVSNGLPRDMTDLDFIAYRDNMRAKVPKTEMLKQLPSIKISNYVFRNNGNVTFSDMTTEWGWSTPTFSAGMAYADLDNDGDLDVAINNTNMKASLLENLANEKVSRNSFLRVLLHYDSLNPTGIGSRIAIYHGGNLQVAELTPYRGYMSSVERITHFGLAGSAWVDSLVVTWPNGNRQSLSKVATNQVVSVDYQINNTQRLPSHAANVNGNLLLSEITKQSKISHAAIEYDYIDFNSQRLIPHKLSQFAPSIACADLDGDLLDDLVIGAGAPLQTTMFRQLKNGTFEKRKIADSLEKKVDDAGICLFDADSDGDVDIYIASGGSEYPANNPVYADKFFENLGALKFAERPNVLPQNNASKSCVRACDFDKDGKLDLFVGGRSIPGQYPKPAASKIYRNLTTENGIVFSDLTNQLAPSLLDLGMVTDAIWSDVDNDSWPDLLVVGEWMPLVIFKNEKGVLKKFSVDKVRRGWWTSITAADLDNDGDQDYVLGNFGTNGFIHPTVEYPVTGIAKDFDGNSSFDAVFSIWQTTSEADLSQKEFPLASRDELISEMAFMRGRFPKYSLYAAADMGKVFDAKEREGSLVVKATRFESGWYENNGNGSFAFHELPGPCQWSPIYGMTVNDLNLDGSLDIILNGNEFSMSPGLGRYDAMNGLVLLGNGKGSFAPQSIASSGFFVPGNGKALVSLNRGGQLTLVAGQNSGRVKVFQGRGSRIISVLPADVYAIITFKDGRSRKQELFFGSSFYSQSSRFLEVNPSIKQIVVFDNNGAQREIPL